MRPVVLLASALLVAGPVSLLHCGSDDPPNGGVTAEGAIGTYKGSFTGASDLSGTIDLRIENGGQAGTRTLAETGPTVTGTIVVNVPGIGPIAVTGTIELDTGKTTFSGTAAGGEIRFGGQLRDGVLSGQFTSPWGSGGFYLAKGTVRSFCGRFEGDVRGRWNVHTLGARAGGVFAASTGQEGALLGTVAGDKVTFQPLTTGGKAEGTLAGDTIEGTWELPSGERGTFVTRESECTSLPPRVGGGGGPDGGAPDGGSPDGGGGGPGVGSIDATFGTNGQASNALGIYQGGGRDLLLLSNGGFVIAGHGETTTYKDSAYAIFGPTGTAVAARHANLSNNKGEEFAKGFQTPGGALLFVGDMRDSTNAVVRVTAARFTAENMLDSSFGIAGGVSTHARKISGVMPELATFGGVLQSTGKLLAVAATNCAASPDRFTKTCLFFSRFTTTGAIDGAAPNQDGSLNDALSDGFGGSTRGTREVSVGAHVRSGLVLKNGADDGFRVLFGTPDGSQLRTFTADGVAVGSPVTSTTRLDSAVWSGTGNIVGVNNGQGGMSIVKLTSALAPVTTFGTNGVKSMGATSVAGTLEDANGRLYVLVLANNAGKPTLSVLRLLVNGDVDASFGTAGQLALPFVPENNGQTLYASGLAFTSDNKLLVAATVGSKFSMDVRAVRVITD